MHSKSTAGKLRCWKLFLAMSVCAVILSSCSGSRDAQILVDPEDTSQKLSYWRDAKVGDWVRFLTHNKKIALFEVTERKEDKIRFIAKHYKLSGEETPEDKPDIREVDIEHDDRIMRDTLRLNPFVERSTLQWKLFNSDKVLMCEHHFVPNPMTGEDNENLWCREIRCGGYVFMRRGNTSVLLLVDYGDAANPLKWNYLKPAELLRYWHENNKFTHETPVPQEDPSESTSPEPPED